MKKIIKKIGVQTRSLMGIPVPLFEGDDALFKDVVSKAVFYGEYGCGASTKWVLNNTKAKVLAVDTAAAWVKIVQSDNAANNDRLNIKHVEVGKLGNWGTPVSYNERKNFPAYTDFIWQQDNKPSVVLVDGRFRVCCFLTSLKHADPGTHIFFDDYAYRPHYHVVEEYLSIAQTCGRQSMFIVPEKSKIDVDALDKDIAAFQHVIG